MSSLKCDGDKLLTFVQTALLQSAQSRFFCRVKNPKFSPHKIPSGEYFHLNQTKSEENGESKR